MQVWTRTAFFVAMASNKMRVDWALMEEESNSLVVKKHQRRLRGEEKLRDNDKLVQLLQVEKTCEYHTPPPPSQNNLEYYNDNKTPFGAILRGEIPARVFAETATLLAFEDNDPKADFHALIIPKREIGSVSDLQSIDLPMLYEMKDMADELLSDSSWRLVFHIAPFNSVQHLHLHVLAPVNTMSLFGRLKYWSETRWCMSWESVVTRLEQDVSAVPYEQPTGY